MINAVAVKERPILFSGPMVNAILDGRKTQTRRVMKPQPELLNNGKVFSWKARGFSFASVVVPPDTRLLLNAQGRPGGPVKCLCPYGKPGERLWVRETTVIHEGKAWYRASGPLPVIPEVRWKWRPSIHMPRWASRITLEIVSVRVERLHQITNADAAAEGFVASDRESPSDAFHNLWDQINGKDSWDANPWVWAVEFHRVDQEAGR